MKRDRFVCVLLSDLAHGSRSGKPFAAARIEHDGSLVPDDQIDVLYWEDFGSLIARFVCRSLRPHISHQSSWKLNCKLSLFYIAEYVSWFHNTLEATSKAEASTHQDYEQPRSHRRIYKMHRCWLYNS